MKKTTITIASSNPFEPGDTLDIIDGVWSESFLVIDVQERNKVTLVANTWYYRLYFKLKRFFKRAKETGTR